MIDAQWIYSHDEYDRCRRQSEGDRFMVEISTLCLIFKMWTPTHTLPSFHPKKYRSTLCLLDRKDMRARNNNAK